MPCLKNCHRSPAVVFNNAACPQWHGTEDDIHTCINNSVPKPGILQSLLSFHFAAPLTTLYTRLCEEEWIRLLIKRKRSLQ